MTTLDSSLPAIYGLDVSPDGSKFFVHFTFPAYDFLREHLRPDSLDIVDITKTWPHPFTAPNLATWGFSQVLTTMKGHTRFTASFPITNDRIALNNFIATLEVVLVNRLQYFKSPLSDRPNRQVVLLRELAPNAPDDPRMSLISFTLCQEATDWLVNKQPLGIVKPVSQLMQDVARRVLPYEFGSQEVQFVLETDGRIAFEVPGGSNTCLCTMLEKWPNDTMEVDGINVDSTPQQIVLLAGVCKLDAIIRRALKTW